MKFIKDKMCGSRFSALFPISGKHDKASDAHAPEFFHGQPHISAQPALDADESDESACAGNIKNMFTVFMHPLFMQSCHGCINVIIFHEPAAAGQKIM